MSAAGAGLVGDRGAAARAPTSRSSTAPAWRSAHVRVVRGTAVCPLSELGDERDARCTRSTRRWAWHQPQRPPLPPAQRQLGELSTFSEAHLLRHQAFFRPQTPESAACARLLGRPLPPDCLADAFRGSAVAREEVDCTPPSRLLLGAPRRPARDPRTRRGWRRSSRATRLTRCRPPPSPSRRSRALEPDVARPRASACAPPATAERTRRQPRRARQPNLPWRRAAAASAAGGGGGARWSRRRRGRSSFRAAPRARRRRRSSANGRRASRRRRAGRSTQGAPREEALRAVQVRGARFALWRWPAACATTAAARERPARSRSADLGACAVGVVRRRRSSGSASARRRSCSPHPEERGHQRADGRPHLAVRRRDGRPPQQIEVRGLLAARVDVPVGADGRPPQRHLALAVDATKPPRMVRPRRSLQDRAARRRRAPALPHEREPRLEDVRRPTTSGCAAWRGTFTGARIEQFAWCARRSAFVICSSSRGGCRRCGRRAALASDWRRPHRYPNGSQAATVRAQVGCFIREGVVARAVRERARTDHALGRGDVDGVVRYSGEAPPVMLFTELLRFVLPQAAYVRRRDGDGGVRPAVHDGRREGGGRAARLRQQRRQRARRRASCTRRSRPTRGAYARRGAGAYADDFALWERARRQEAVERRTRAWRRRSSGIGRKCRGADNSEGAADVESGDRRGGCSCSACCWARGSRRRPPRGRGRRRGAAPCAGSRRRRAAGCRRVGACSEVGEIASPPAQTPPPARRAACAGTGPRRRGPHPERRRAPARAQHARAFAARRAALDHVVATERVAVRVAAHVHDALHRRRVPQSAHHARVAAGARRVDDRHDAVSLRRPAHHLADRVLRPRRAHLKLGRVEAIRLGVHRRIGRRRCHRLDADDARSCTGGARGRRDGEAEQPAAAADIEVDDGRTSSPSAGAASTTTASSTSAAGVQTWKKARGEPSHRELDAGHAHQLADRGVGRRVLPPPRHRRRRRARPHRLRRLHARLAHRPSARRSPAAATSAIASSERRPIRRHMRAAATRRRSLAPSGAPSLAARRRRAARALPTCPSPAPSRPPPPPSTPANGTPPTPLRKAPPPSGRRRAGGAQRRAVAVAADVLLGLVARRRRVCVPPRRAHHRRSPCQWSAPPRPRRAASAARARHRGVATSRATRVDLTLRARTLLGIDLPQRGDGVAASRGRSSRAAEARRHPSREQHRCVAPSATAAGGAIGARAAAPLTVGAVGGGGGAGAG